MRALNISVYILSGAFSCSRIYTKNLKSPGNMAPFSFYQPHSFNYASTNKKPRAGRGSDVIFTTKNLSDDIKARVLNQHLGNSDSAILCLVVFKQRDHKS